MAKRKENFTHLKEFDAGYLINPFLCKTHLRAKVAGEKMEKLRLTFCGIDMGKHVGYRKK